MLSPKVHEALNRQINAELYSSYLYLSMEAYFESVDLKGMAHWIRGSKQRRKTPMPCGSFEFFNDRNGRVTLTAIEAPKVEWKSPLEAFEDAYRHEQKSPA